METKRFPSGTPIFREGDAGDSAYLVASGVVEVSREVEGSRTVLGEIRPGHIFGEMALINNKPRMAAAMAKEDTDCVVVPTAAFASELGESNAFMRALVLNLIGRIRSLSDQLERAMQDAGAPPGTDDGGGEPEFYVPDGDGTYSRTE